MLVTREREGREREVCYGEGIGGAYFEPGKEFWGLGFGNLKGSKDWEGKSKSQDEKVEREIKF